MIGLFGPKGPSIVKTRSFVFGGSRNVRTSKGLVVKTSELFTMAVRTGAAVVPPRSTMTVACAALGTAATKPNTSAAHAESRPFAEITRLAS